MIAAVGVPFAAFILVAVAVDVVVHVIRGLNWWI